MERIQRLIAHMKPEKTEPTSSENAANQKMWKIVHHSLLHNHIYIGQQYDLYTKLKSAKSPSVLAKEAGLNTRVVEEWCLCMAANEFLDLTDGKFQLRKEWWNILTNPNSVLYNGFTWVSPGKRVADLMKWYESGVGHGYDDAEWDKAMRLDSNNIFEHVVPSAIEKSDAEIASRLQCGARVCEIGCGQGKLVFELARRFPNATFHGYDIAPQVIKHAQETYHAHNLRYTTQNFLEVDEKYDLVVIFDMLHDCTDPVSILAAARRCLTPGGMMFVCDTRGEDSWEEKIRSEFAPLTFSFSLAVCLPSSMSAPGGAGLGAMGIGPGVMRSLCAQAGLHNVHHYDHDNLPFNRVYKIRP